MAMFMEQTSLNDLRVQQRSDGWVVSNGRALLLRPNGSVYFKSVEHVMGRLAASGIRCATVNWELTDAILEFE